MLLLALLLHWPYACSTGTLTARSFPSLLTPYASFSSI